MDWEHPYVLLLALPAVAILIWLDARSVQPIPSGRRRALLVVRSLLVLLALLAIASPARTLSSARRAVVFVVDHSRSLGSGGLTAAREAAAAMRSKLPADVATGLVMAGADARLVAAPDGASNEWQWPESTAADAPETNLAAAVSLGEGLFPAGVARHIVLITDGEENRGSLERRAREAAVARTVIHTIAVPGEARPDVRLPALKASQMRLTEGATVDLTATVESSLAGSGAVRLFENGVQVDERPLTLAAGESRSVVFSRAPDIRNTYTYRAVVEGFTGDTIPENNEALALVDVRGKPLWLYIEGEPEEARYLTAAMEKEGIRLLVRTTASMPQSVRELAGFDGVILSDVPAHELGEAWMAALRDYVGTLGGGLVMIGGVHSFGVGGYYRTPVEELLPVKLEAPDQEEQQSSALALVIDRSGSMSGAKLEFCKSAAVATAELLTAKDFLGIYAFDSQVQSVVPMTRVPAAGGAAVASPVNGLTSGGGTNVYPGMAAGRDGLNSVKAKIKHMIVLTDGQTEGQGYEALAASCRAEGMTISTVAVGGDAAVALLHSIAAAGGGQAYHTMDPAAITRIFTQDTMIHTGRLIHEEAFQPTMVERHPILKNLTTFESPPLLGYVKTNRRATSQVPLVTGLGDPLLAFWHYELGKVTAFTSDCKSRWAAPWIAGWPGYSQLWAQLLRETARAPEGQNMDLTLVRDGENIVCEVALLEDAGTFRNDARVDADVFFMPTRALGAPMKPRSTLTLDQAGPGTYRGSFRPDDSGVYLVRARAGASVVSAADVFNPSPEAATGKVNETLLKRAAQVTGGEFFAATNLPATFDPAGLDTSSYRELRPYILGAFIVLLMADILLRRWEHVEAAGAALRALGRRRPGNSPPAGLG